MVVMLPLHESRLANEFAYRGIAVGRALVVKWSGCMNIIIPCKHTVLEQQCTGYFWILRSCEEPLVE